MNIKIGLNKPLHDSPTDVIPKVGCENVSKDTLKEVIDDSIKYVDDEVVI